ncbi:IS110 family transposase, partial [Paenibacillus piri]
TVIAPSLIPQKPGEKVKTDRRDAIKLAQLFRAGELTGIYVPTEEDEALRDLVRAREAIKEDRQRTRHRITKFLLRYNLVFSEKGKKWGTKHRTWLNGLSFSSPALRIVFQEYLHQLDELDERMKRFESEIHRQAEASSKAPVIQALQCFRGIAELTAVTLVIEIGSFVRFAKARDFMGYTGLVPSERSTGLTRRQGAVTRTGNPHVRRVLVEAAWCYRYKPAVKGALKNRQQGQPGDIQATSWKAQHRLHNKYMKMNGRGKPGGKTTAAIARELAGFIWAVARRTEVTLQES